MVTKTLIIIPKKREKEMISRMKFWCVRLRKRGEMFTKMMENVIVNDQRKVLKASKTLGFLNLKISSDNNLITKP